MKGTGHRISAVAAGSIAEELGIEPGDRLLSVNGRELVDIIDYMELTGWGEFEICILKKNGEEWLLDIEKEEDEDLGIEFCRPLLDKQRSCANRCIFCFIDQLPPNMRETLYYKDDDWRLSFLMGNYITLTNLSSKDIKRIIEKRISPLYVSIHSTNPEVRKRMLGNSRAGEAYEILKKFREGGIELHCQIVLCPGWNDGYELDRTLGDLWEIKSSVKSVAVVPVGLTGYRQGLEHITPFGCKSANALLDQIENWQGYFMGRGDTRFVFPADEFYITAKRDFPPYGAYEDFPQIENGVGLVAKFKHEFFQAESQLTRDRCHSGEVSIVTGISAVGLIKELAGKISEMTGITVNVYPIPNRFFGGQVTVSGLVAGGDIVEELRGKPLGDRILIPNVMLRKGEDVFLDDMTLEELGESLSTPVIPVPVEGKALIDAILD